MMMKTIFILAMLLLVGISNAQAITKKDILNHYADLAFVVYNDSLSSAEALEKSLQLLVKQPTEKNLQAAKTAWKVARVPYQQTEAYRFGNAIVDEWEGKVNAWPLDEGLIDYVASDYGDSSEDNTLYTANVIANKNLKLSGNTVDASNINKILLSETLHEIDGVEANVATGYHAIEFLLWGQDLNGTNHGAGQRPASDFNRKNCTNGHCDRRAQYLLVAADLLIDDLKWMVKQWTKQGEARLSLLKDEAEGINTIFTGMGSLSYGELAGERIKLGVMLHDPEEEHDCFSDNTHNSHYYDIQGIQNVYTGSYKTLTGAWLSGPSLSDLVAATNKQVDNSLRSNITASLQAAKVLVDSAEKEGVSYDQLLAEGNEAGNRKIMGVVNALLEQTKSIELAVQTVGLANIEFEGSDSLDSPQAVFQ